MTDGRSFAVLGGAASARLMVTTFLIGVAGLTVSAMAAEAQLLGLREAEVTIPHAPLIPVGAETVFLPEPLDQCEEELSRTLATLFFRAGFQVVEGARLNAVLSEHATPSSSGLDPAVLMAAGRALGPSVLIEVRSRVCETRQDRSEQSRLSHRQVRTTTGRAASGSRATTEDLEVEDQSETTESVTTVEVLVVDRVARTGATVTLSIQVFDLTSDRVYGEIPLSSSANLREELTLEHPWGDDWPEAPTPEQAVAAAVRKLSSEVRRLFFSSSERRSVWFYNNDKCDLESAYRAMRADSLDRALELSIRNLEACRQDPRIKKRVLGNAYQNLGLTQTFIGHPEEGLANLREAAALRPGRIVTEAIADAEKALEEHEAGQRFRERTVSVRDAWGVLAERFEAAGAKAAEEQGSEVLGNADIVAMVEAGLPDAVILARIESGATGFSLQTDDLKALSDAGVSETVIVAMISAVGTE